MYIKKLELSNFRNYQSLDLSFVPGINVLYGENGSGKTNILEALYWVSMIKSFRTSEDYIMVRKGSDAASIGLEASENDLSKLYSFEYSLSNKRKLIKENNNKLSRVSKVIGKIPLVLFSPENIMVIKGEPSLRRRFIDDMLSQINPEYYTVLQKYSKEVSHRNYLLKGIREGDIPPGSLDVWNSQVMENGKRILLARKEAIKMLNAILSSKLIESPGMVELRYFSKRFSSLEPDDITEAFREFFSRHRDEEIARATTLIGPHRDDIEILYKGAGAKQYASEGQQRLTAILIKLAEGLLIRERRGIFPVVLLDDFSSELDIPNRGFIGNTFKQFKQIIITTTYKSNLEGFNPAREFTVKDGKVVENI